MGRRGHPVALGLLFDSFAGRHCIGDPHWQKGVLALSTLPGHCLSTMSAIYFGKNLSEVSGSPALPAVIQVCASATITQLFN